MLESPFGKLIQRFYYLFFVRGKAARADIVSSVKKFSPREKVWLDFTVRNSAGDVVKGDFVVSVTDA
ncbi:MAG: hypothetical protein IJ948_04985, partial [Clostridia bacterium]|nr:hypothetical protein [Clostridia bacterium]